ncbi:MAG TPA: hypothetical protein VN626_00395 [Clostridia bacterium]|nr:hypothetical protein [Clostridia bacterium]
MSELMSTKSKKEATLLDTSILAICGGVAVVSMYPPFAAIGGLMSAAGVFGIGSFFATYSKFDRLLVQCPYLPTERARELLRPLYVERVERASEPEVVDFLKELYTQRETLRAKADVLRKEKVDEQDDVDRLECHSLTAFFYGVIGKMDEKLDKEREEAYNTADKTLLIDALKGCVKTIDIQLERINIKNKLAVAQIEADRLNEERTVNRGLNEPKRDDWGR